MWETRITRLLNIRYPILMGGMHRLSTAEMVGALAEAGGLGFIPAASFRSPEELRREIRKARSITDKPIGLNVSLIPSVYPGEGMMREMIDVGIEERVAAFETAGGSPAPFVDQMKKAKIPILHKVTQVKFAQKAAALGVDAVIVIGFEGGGYIGSAEIASLVLTGNASRAVSIPVIAAGGFVDGRGLMAALSLGAEGVLMGTRFIASTEAGLRPGFSEWMVRAGEGDTTLLMKSFNNPVRFLRNKVTQTVETMEREGQSISDILNVISPAQSKDIRSEDDTENRLFPVGQGISLIGDVKPIREIVEDIILEAEQSLSRLNMIRK